MIHEAIHRETKRLNTKLEHRVGKWFNIDVFRALLGFPPDVCNRKTVESLAAVVAGPNSPRQYVLIGTTKSLGGWPILTT